MKHLLPFRVYESKTTSGLTPDQEVFLNEYTDGTWSVNPETGLVDVRGNFNCSKRELKSKSLQGVSFGQVSGDFYCYKNQLTTLEGAPQTVGGSFSCRYNRLTSLAGSPQTVGGNFYCDAFELEQGEWNPSGWVKILSTGNAEARKLILTLPYLQPDWLNSELQRDPGNTVHILAQAWKYMPEEIKSGIVIPPGYEDELGLFSDFDDLGLF